MIHLEELVLDGFRGYVGEEKIDLSQGSVFVFAPNGRGKSSITDAFEFLFSEDGTVKRLGLRDSGTQTGRQPLRNANKAANERVTVTLTWRENGTKKSATREVTLSRSAPTGDLPSLLGKTRAPFIIRGHDLRKFIEVTTPTDRYKECAEYLGATRLSRLQDDLQSLKYKLTQSDRTNERRSAATREVQRNLGSSPPDLSDAAAVLTWINAEFARIGIAHLTSVSNSDPSMDALRDRAAEERSRSTLAEMQRIVGEIDVLLESDDNGPILTAPLRALRKATEEHAALLNESSDSRRHDVLREAIIFLKGDGVSSCPVCETSLAQTMAGSREALLVHLEAVQSAFAKLTSSAEAESNARVASSAHRNTIASRLTAIASVLKLEPATETSAYWTAAYNAADGGSEEPMEAFLVELRALREEAAGRAEAAKTTGHRVAEPLLNKVSALIAQYDAWQRIDVDAAAIRELRGEIDAVVTLVNTEVHAFLESTVSALANDTAKIYNKIQQGAPVSVSVSLRLLPADSGDARKMEMVLDFPTVGDTKPQGYLSDSQVNTLALAFRIAITRRFNPVFRFMILDDVFTSHDAEFRDQAAELIATELRDTQLLVMTHDDLFARLIQDKVTSRGDDGRWNFLRIAAFDLAKGPRFLARQTPEARLVSTWQSGEVAGGMLRSWVEEWLEKLSRQLGAQFTMRRPTRPYDYAHFEMATAVRDVLKERYNSDNTMASVPEFSSAINELVGAVIENEGSHHHANPYSGTDASLERRFYDRVKRLQQYFRCGAAGCGGKLEFDPARRRAVCARDHCGHVFELQATPW